jgi:hypothetical protein
MGRKKDLVVKSNRLIEASYRLTLAEQRIILFSIVTARQTRKGLSADDFVTIQAGDYAAMFHVPLKQAYEQIKEATKTLFRRYVILYDTHQETGKPRKIEVRWLSAASYIDGAGAIQLRFATDMVPFITRLETEFTRYKLGKIANMTSAYAIRLYELLVQWGSVGEREIELGWLKKTLMLEKDYPRMFDFKKRVIDVALSQINAHSDLTAQYTQRKTGRIVTHLIFTFAPKATAPLGEASSTAIDSDPIRDSELFQRLRHQGVGVRLALAWLRQDQERVRFALEYVETRVRQGQIKGSTAGYLRTLLEGGAEIGPSAAEVQREAQARAAETAQCAEAQQRSQDLREQEDRKQARAAVLALPPKTRSALLEEYRQGEGATASWDESRGEFRDALERIRFNCWLHKRVVSIMLPTEAETD